LRARASWLTTRCETPLQVATRLPLLPLSWLYGAGAWVHRALYRKGVFRRSHFPGHVVSVGNLVVGGTGKTPLAAWIAAGLRRRGRNVAIASRGCGRRGSEPVIVVSDGRFVLSRAEVAGDEAMVLAAHAPGVPVLVGRNRALVGWRAVSVFGADVLVLDDGFQHHGLHRNLDLVTFDGGLGCGNRRVLPRGPLREPARALRHADAIGVVDGPLPAADAAFIERIAPGARRFGARRAPVRLRPLGGGAAASPELLKDAEVGLLAALADPAGFRRSLESLGARVVAERTFCDHHRYRERDLRGIAAEAPLWVTTEKDAIKILPPWVGRADVRVLQIEPEVAEPDLLLDWIDSRLR
jgi:tetraacyldisaccharide 4'-kinase